jgi:hypothetical protein
MECEMGFWMKIEKAVYANFGKINVLLVIGEHDVRVKA